MKSSPTQGIRIDILLRFNTIKQLTTSPSDIVVAVENHCSNMLRIEDNKSICRIDPFDFQKKDENIPLSLFVENLPQHIKVPDVLEAFEIYGTVTLVRLLKNKMIGNCVVEFESVEILEKAALDLIGENKKRDIMCKGNNLKVQKMQDWIKQNRNKKSNKDSNPQKKDSNPQKKDYNHQKRPKNDVVISLKGLVDGCDRDDIQESISNNFEGNKFRIDYSKGLKDGYIRFFNNCNREKILELATNLKAGKIQICGHVVDDAYVLANEEEEQYWKQRNEFKKKRAQHNFGKHQHRRKRYRR